jgi:hypothetical protein
MNMESRARHAEGQLSDETKYALLAGSLSTRSITRGPSIVLSLALAVGLVAIALMVVL